MEPYERLGPRAFGTYLLDSGDLDPVYIGLHGLQLPPGGLAAWLVSYWCFYHAGVSCQLVGEEYERYWERMEELAGRRAGPRGTERRHFRGPKAPAAILYLKARYGSPLNVLEDLASGPLTFGDISARVQQWPLFGPWIAFKIADMLERCAGVPVDFSDCELSMYQEPIAGALLVAEQEGWPFDLRDTVRRLREIYGGRQAPPAFDRPVGLQEIETILCKFKSHWRGHYPLGKDTNELRHTLGDPHGPNGGWGPLAWRMKQILEASTRVPA